MDTAKSRRPWVARIVVFLFVLVATGIGGGVWFVLAQLGTMPDGTRVSLVPLGGVVTAERQAGQLPIELAAELAAAGLMAHEKGMGSEVEQTFILRREKHSLRIWLSVGDQPVAMGPLGYTLFDAGGNVLSQGTLTAEVRLAAPAVKTVQIADPNLPNTKRVEIRKLP